MKVESQFSEPESVKDRQPYRLRIEGKDGQVFEIFERDAGGFCIVAPMLDSACDELVIAPQSYGHVTFKIMKGP